MFSKAPAPAQIQGKDKSKMDEERKEILNKQRCRHALSRHKAKKAGCCASQVLRNVSFSALLLQQTVGRRNPEGP